MHHITRISRFAFLFSFLAPTLFSTACLAEKTEPPSEMELRIQAGEIIQQFASQLKPKLKHAMANNGPTHAINVCAKQAPAIAARLSDTTGWSVKRVSLKSRNAAATPDDWEKQKLLLFEKLNQQGAPAETLVASEYDGNRFRFMKAQKVEPICLTCHGTHVSSEVRAALDQHYPSDQATGYELGDVRGAFSLIWSADINRDSE